jgi:hypothetical protein
MGYRAIPLVCFCGDRPDRILEVGLTSDQAMVIHFWCSTCNRVLFVTKGLAECAQECPAPDAEDAPPQAAMDDARFLQSLGIAAME